MAELSIWDKIYIDRIRSKNPQAGEYRIKGDGAYRHAFLRRFSVLWINCRHGGIEPVVLLQL